MWTVHPLETCPPPKQRIAAHSRLRRSWPLTERLRRSSTARLRRDTLTRSHTTSPLSKQFALTSARIASASDNVVAPLSKDELVHAERHPAKLKWPRFWSTSWQRRGGGGGGGGMRRRTRTTRTLQSAAALNNVFKSEHTRGCAAPNHWLLIEKYSLARTSSQGRRKSGAKRDR